MRSLAVFCLSSGHQTFDYQNWVRGDQRRSGGFYASFPLDGDRRIRPIADIRCEVRPSNRRTGYPLRVQCSPKGRFCLRPLCEIEPFWPLQLVTPAAYLATNADELNFDQHAVTTTGKLSFEHHSSPPIQARSAALVADLSKSSLGPPPSVAAKEAPYELQHGRIPNNLAAPTIRPVTTVYSRQGYASCCGGKPHDHVVAIAGVRSLKDGRASALPAKSTIVPD